MNNQVDLCVEFIAKFLWLPLVLIATSQHHHLPPKREHYLDPDVRATSSHAPQNYKIILRNRGSDFLSVRHNKKTCQWDVRANEVTMEYGEHLGPVNTATLIDDDRCYIVFT